MANSTSIYQYNATLNAPLHNLTQPYQNVHIIHLMQTYNRLSDSVTIKKSAWHFGASFLRRYPKRIGKDWRTTLLHTSQQFHHPGCIHQSGPSIDQINYCHLKISQLLAYVISYLNDTMRYHKINMRLHSHSNASYLPRSQVCSRAGYFSSAAHPRTQ